jgi:hypothetical protein
MSDQDPAAAFAAARANIRDTAKWVMAATAGAVGLVIGSAAFSQLGAMDGSNPRLRWAYAALALGAAAAGFVFLQAVAVLKSELMTLREIMAAPEGLMAEARQRAAAKLDGQIPLGTLARFHKHYEVLRQTTLSSPAAGDHPAALAKVRAAAELAALTPYQSFCSQTCVTEYVSLRFDRLMLALIGPGAVAMIAFVVFAWAANPGPAKPGPPPVYQVRVVGAGR